MLGQKEEVLGNSILFALHFLCKPKTSLKNRSSIKEKSRQTFGRNRFAKSKIQWKYKEPRFARTLVKKLEVGGLRLPESRADSKQVQSPGQCGTGIGRWAHERKGTGHTEADLQGQSLNPRGERILFATHHTGATGHTQQKQRTLTPTSYHTHTSTSSQTRKLL